MLVLSRKKGERIQIDGDITLTVLSIQGGRVQLGFAAPAHIAIQREEVRRRIEEDQARGFAPTDVEAIGAR
jgi:carbon storage regulator